MADILSTNGGDMQPTGGRTALRWCGKIFGTLVLVGFLTALVFLCIFAMYIKNDLSEQVDFSVEGFALDQTSVIYYEDRETGRWKELKKLYSSENRVWVGLEEIPINLKNACVAIEDKRFNEHQGVDWIRSARAGVDLFMGNKSLYGASTITQQLIKNLTHDDEITVRRKLLEILRALDFEDRYSKDDILEWYLNIIPLGQGCYGVQAASEVYFGKDVEDLSLAECASLIGITNNPSLFDPYLRPEKNKERQQIILSEMLQQGMISENQYEKALEEELVFVNTSGEDEGDAFFTYFEDQVINDVVYDLMEKTGYDYKVALRMLQTGGYKIYATIDPEIQAQVDRVYQDLNKIPKTASSQQLESAIVITDNETGDIVALSGGVGKKTGSLVFNNATQARLQPGSIIKPITTYAPALENGSITPITVYDDTPHQFTNEYAWPKNSDSVYHGLMSVNDAMCLSLNTVAVKVVDEQGIRNCFDFAQQRFGMNLLEESVTSTGSVLTDLSLSALALGGLNRGVTVREMTAAYTVFPSDGIYREARTYTKVLDANGEVVLDNTQDTNQAISEKTAWYSNYMMMNTVTDGTGVNAALKDMQVAGKTGTTSDDKDRWFAGYTPYYTAVVWCGYSYPEEIVLTESTVNPAVYLWHEVMEGVHKELEYAQFHKPTDVITVSYCYDSGHLATDACRQDPRGDRTVTAELYMDDVPTENCTVHRMVDMCSESKHVANEYCAHVKGNGTYKQSMLNIVRGFPTPGIVVEDQEYVVCDTPLKAGLFTPVAVEVDAQNLECYIHSKDDLPKENDEDEEEKDDDTLLGDLIDQLMGGR
ncbi:MAG: PBP1A family penicillin-binding protein [Oscillospiraceae bacterium]|nr:PBP1A family penicillin-binding protein [Oscillospiraceae bacterium]